MSKKRIKLIALICILQMILSGCTLRKVTIEAPKDDELPPKDDTAIETIIPTPMETPSTDKGENTTTPPTVDPTPEPTPDFGTDTTPIEPIEPDDSNKIEEDDLKEEELKDNIIVKATTNVNMRSSNTAESLKIGGLKKNDKAYKILSCDNNWDLVLYNNQIGYVCRDYLEYTDEIIETEYVHKKHNDIVIAKEKIDFRISPTIDSAKISDLEKNTELKVIAEVDNGWILVKINGVLGYVSKDKTVSLLELAKLEYPELNLTELDVKKISYSTTNLNVRKGNSTDYEKISMLEKYESVRVIDEYDGWYLVMTNDYNFGFISKDYTKDLGDAFVVVDLSEQRLYMYNDDEQYYMTPVTTGKDSTPSDIGLFEIYSKQTDRYLTGPGYKSFVNYWMPYNGGEGLHDASWRNVFGTQQYKTNGSHGCINMPPEIADDIYNNVSIGTKVLVHK